MFTQTVQVEEGIFIPRRLLPRGGEWLIIITENEIILRPKVDKETAHRRLREISDELRQKYGELPDSSELIRQDRDER